MTSTATPTGAAALSAADIRRRLAPFRRPSLARAGWQLGSTLALLAALAWAMWLCLGVSYALVLLLALPAGGLLVRLFIFQHDCGHGSYFRSARANRYVGYALGLFTLTPYEDWRYAHALHHAAHGDLDHRGDGDVRTLTVDEYRGKGWWGRLGYRLYRHPLVMFGLFPTLLFVVRFRSTLGVAKHLTRQRRSVWYLNACLAVCLVAVHFTVGLGPFFLIYAPTFVFAATIGVWMFFVQHQFDPTYWERHEQWDRTHASLHGSSYYKLPAVLRWFTGSIGLHHIHHLDSRVPNYRLQACLDANRDLLDVPPLTMRASLRCASLKLWDESAGRMVGFKAAREPKPTPRAGLGDSKWAA